MIARWWGFCRGRLGSAKHWVAQNFRSIPFVGGVLALAVAIGVVVLFAATRSSEKTGGPGVQSLQCAPGQNVALFQAGQQDGFNANADLPAAAPSAGLAIRLPPPLAGFDATGLDRRFAHSFAGLPVTTAAGEVEIGLKPIATSIHPAAENDTVELSFTNASGSLQPGAWSRYLGSGNASLGLLPSQWLPSNWAGGHVFTFDIASLANPSGPPSSLLADLNSLGYLDVVVQDDTSVDYVTLRLCVPVAAPTPFPSPLVGTVTGKLTPVPSETPTPLAAATILPLPCGGLLNSCTPTPMPPPAPTDTPTPTNTPAPTATCGPAGSLSPCTPTPALSPQPSVSPAPTATCGPAGSLNPCTATPTLSPQPSVSPSPTATCGPAGTASACTPTPTRVAGATNTPTATCVSPIAGVCQAQ